MKLMTITSRNISVKITQSDAFAFPGSRFPSVPKKAGNVIFYLGTAEILDDNQQITFPLPMGTQLKSLVLSKNTRPQHRRKPHFQLRKITFPLPASHLLRRVLLLGTTFLSKALQYFWNKIKEVKNGKI